VAAQQEARYARTLPCCVCSPIAHCSSRTGYGEQTWPNGNKYEGEWAGGLREGRGTMWIKGKDGKLRKVYSGNWKKDVKDVSFLFVFATLRACSVGANGAGSGRALL
jgi:hypothetical protein